MWQKIFAWSKKVHRIAMWLVIVLGMIMMASGYVMNRELAGQPIPPRDVMMVVRSNHVTASMWFLWSFLAQAVSGVLMWLAPKILMRARKVTPPAN